MNYSLSDLPDSGKDAVVYMDIMLNNENMGRLYIRLFRDVFPAGVENFIRIAAGNTYRVVKNGNGKYTYKKEIKRTYEGCKIFRFLHNNYLVCGDIYNNDGTNAGTIYSDQPIAPVFGDFYYPHETKGLVSLVPYHDETTGRLFYDSTFMITLDDIKPSNILHDLDQDQIVIGQIYDGLDVLDKMNQLIKPYARRRYPRFVIGETGVYRKNSNNRRMPPKPKESRKFCNEPTCCE